MISVTRLVFVAFTFSVDFVSNKITFSNVTIFLSSIYSPFLLLVPFQLIENWKIHWYGNHAICFGFSSSFTPAWIEFNIRRVNGIFSVSSGIIPVTLHVFCVSVHIPFILRGWFYLGKIWWNITFSPHNNSMFYFSDKILFLWYFHLLYHFFPFQGNTSPSYFHRALVQLYGFTGHIFLS